MATQQTAGKKGTTNTAPAKKKPANKSAAKKTPAKTGKATTGNYTDPALREKLKAEVIAGDKGGRAGQWSARKAQLLAHEYAAAGGGYKHPPDGAQNSLKEWGEEHWHTESGEQAIQGETTHRYLPDAAWKELSPQERKATEEKKVGGSRRGKQFVANTASAAKARKHATEAKPAK